jgi:hypothetical protein
LVQPHSRSGGLQTFSLGQRGRILEGQGVLERIHDNVVDSEA